MINDVEILYNFQSIYVNGHRRQSRTDVAHWTYWLQILSELCFQRVALSGNYEIVAISNKAMKSSPLLGPFCGSEFWGFSLLKI